MDCSQLLRLILVSTLLCSLAHAEIHQWRDEQGRLHFSDRAPEYDASHDQGYEADVVKENDRRAGVVHFHRTDFALSDAAEQQVRAGLDTILSLYTQTLGLDVRGDIAVNLSLLKDKKEFNSWISERVDTPVSAAVTGVYLTKSKEVAVWNWASEDRVVETILHESSHVILAQLAPSAPSWIHEGMAQYVQTLQQHPNGIEITPHGPAAARIRDWVDKGELISLRQYLNLPEQHWRQMAHNMNAIPYSVAWATTYFMMSSTVGQQTLRRLLHDMEKSGKWPSAEAIDARYPGGLVKMDYDFFRWAQGDMSAHYY